MTEDLTTRTRRRASLRKLLYTPLAVGVLAGAVCTGTGLSTATALPAPDAVINTPDALPASTGDAHWWSLYNDTGQPIYGEWSEQVGSPVSGLEVVKDWQMPQGGHESRPRINESFTLAFPYWWGHICYDHKQWNLGREERNVSDEGRFTLTARPGGGLDVVWEEGGGGGGIMLAAARVTRTEHLVENVAEGAC
ncbi:hypothetical protein [Rhodococcus jostii]|uniref:hypothetical protein n=1 Tax=Rhodococcus jostii TaxID=132919 RepID=UPI00362B2FBE